MLMMRANRGFLFLILLIATSAKVQSSPWGYPVLASSDEIQRELEQSRRDLDAMSRSKSECAMRHDQANEQMNGRSENPTKAASTDCAW